MNEQDKDAVNENHVKPTPRPKPDILKYFKYDHLPSHLQAVSKPFCILALSIAGEVPNGEIGIADVLPDGPERTVALRKLLEAKDAAVRTLVWD